MQPTTYHTKELRPRYKREMQEQTNLTLTNGDMRFVNDFISETGFYIEHLEEHIGEELTDFWQTREHALRILTDWMMQAMNEPMVNVSRN